MQGILKNEKRNVKRKRIAADEDEVQRRYRYCNRDSRKTLLERAYSGAESTVFRNKFEVKQAFEYTEGTLIRYITEKTSSVVSKQRPTITMLCNGNYKKTLNEIH